jgi:hypothetical protein
VKKTYLSAVMIVLAVITMTAGCVSPNVKLKQEKYIPSFNAEDFKEYKGAGIYLPRFANKAENATIWFYSSIDKKRNYMMKDVEQFFWTCFQASFMHAGIFVYDTNFPVQTVNMDEKVKQGLKEFRLQLSSLNDLEFRFIVTLFDRGTIIFQRKFIIPMDPPETEDKAKLEERAYRMIDKSFRTILKDQGFRDSFLKNAVAGKEPVKGD